MSDPVRLTRFLVQRLVDMGVELKYFDGESSARGELPLSTTPFQTLGDTFVLSRARFYTLGHSQLKFHSPGVFFDLPPVDVSRCDSMRDLESTLRRAWSKRMKDLSVARAWLEQLGAQSRVSGHGTRLLLPMTAERTPPTYVRTNTELLVPSGGPLADVSLAEPAERRYRPIRNLELGAELELGLSHAMTRLAQANADRRHQVTLATPDEQLVHVPRVLAVDEEAVSLAALEAGLADQGFRVFGYRDPARALEAFHERSYDLVVTNARLRRADGLEFTARLQDLAGIEKLPVVLLDERANRSTQEAAHAAGASAYLTRPAAWTDMSAVLTDLLDGARWRRFVRYPLRLGVDVACGDRAISELTTSVARGGISISTRREVQIGQIERYRLHMPKPLPKIVVDGVVVTRMAKAGAVSILAGIRILRFLAPDGEMHWIRLIEELARRAAARANPGSER